MPNNLIRTIGIALLAGGLFGATARLATMTIIPAVYPFLSVVGYVLIALVGGGLYDWARNRDEGRGEKARNDSSDSGAES